MHTIVPTAKKKSMIATAEFNGYGSTLELICTTTF